MTSNIANDYYVSISGDDSNPGTLDLPFKTIQHATSIVEAGDTVYIRGGTYREKISIENLHGTKDNLITFKNYNDEEVVVSLPNQLLGFSEARDQLLFLLQYALDFALLHELRRSLHLLKI